MRIYFYNLLLIVLLSISNSIHAQDTITNIDSNITISVLTCGVGEDLYASFGHSGIRVQDKARGIDEVYNYGTFDFEDPDFYTKFVLGKLDYFLSKSSYQKFIYEYEYFNRSVKEQVLKLDYNETQDVVAFLENNLSPKNKYYKYDFIYDNCATRIRDVFSNVMQNRLNYGNILRDNKISYRQAINSYIRNNHWSRVGINLLFGATTDSAMSDNSSMFLPDYLHEGFKGAQVDAFNIVSSEKLLVKGNSIPFRNFNGPFWVSIAILLLTFLSYHTKFLSPIKGVMNFIILFVSGILGIFMLFMWLGTSHKCCTENYNILWALPTNVIMAFIIFSPRKWFKFYALIGITLLIVSLIIHIMGIQELPLIDIVPFLCALMYVYIDLYKKSLIVIVQDASSRQMLHE